MNQSEIWRAIICVEDAINAFVKTETVPIIGTLTMCLGCGERLPSFGSLDHGDNCPCLSLWDTENKMRAFANRLREEQENEHTTHG